MRRVLFINLLILLAICPCFSQSIIKDSVFVKINELDPKLFDYGMFDGKIIALTFRIKNKYENTLGFGSGYTNNDLTLRNKQNISLTKIVSYYQFNEMLNNDFRNMAYYHKMYFILSEDRGNYLVLQVRPILPPVLNKQ